MVKKTKRGNSLYYEKAKAARKQQSIKCRATYIPNSKNSNNIDNNRRTNLRYTVYICFIDKHIKEQKL